jgi:hypothetical protein
MAFAAAVLGVHVRPGPDRAALALRRRTPCGLRRRPGGSGLEARMCGAAGLHLCIGLHCRAAAQTPGEL